ncbi:zinc-ribbon domain-containing protein [Hansschlegelia beijingensis]|uniref:Putative Zn finger-like uncharacterized protein n=1 Tax=Hansschlegelia beijingensis TaxID=1133344 RepID=A0A7W6CZJ3_9HYPH|nr:zinc-ribbon domain-containing protein [Hansschlegelia beijingensis]MBB3973973.1 putative Zn finger-like uncharacterized protein [Hansschlegelia beijingensis]
MLVTCPSCQSSYRLAEGTLYAGRKLRCARCRTSWIAEPPPTEVPQPASQEESASGVASADTSGDALLPPILGLEDAAAVEVREAPELIEAVPAPPRTEPARQSRWPLGSRRRRNMPARRGAASRSARRPRLTAPGLIAAAGLALLAALVLFPLPVVRAAPSLASLYAAVGLPVNVRGLAIQDVSSSELTDEGAPLLLVKGSIASLARAAVDVPRLRVAVLAADGRELYAWTTMAARAKLAPGETTTFRARLASPPAEGRTVAVRFLGRQDLAAHATR